MATVIKLQIQVSKLDNVLTKFDQMKIYRSIAGINGTYIELTTSTTRLSLEQGKELYEFDDTAGEITYWYKTSYYHSSTGLESSLSEPRLGDDPATATIMTVSEMKSLYLFGLDLTDDAGNEFPDLMFEWGIRWAIGYLQRQLDILIKPTEMDERYDYYRNDYQNWTTIQLHESPVVSVESVSVMWPSDVTVIDFPTEWIQLRKEGGLVNIVHASGSIAQAMLTAGGNFLPLLAGATDFIPNALRVQYTAGFAAGEVPIEIRDLVGKLASLGPLHTAGDLIAGAGIASKSISIDGLSQSINTTSSATNSGYGARTQNYLKEIKEQLPVLRRYYKGLKLAALG